MDQLSFTCCLQVNQKCYTDSIYLKKHTKYKSRLKWKNPQLYGKFHYPKCFISRGILDSQDFYCIAFFFFFFTKAISQPRVGNIGANQVYLEAGRRPPPPRAFWANASRETQASQAPLAVRTSARAWVTLSPDASLSIEPLCNRVDFNRLFLPSFLPPVLAVSRFLRWKHLPDFLHAPLSSDQRVPGSCQRTWEPARKALPSSDHLTGRKSLTV